MKIIGCLLFVLCWGGNPSFGQTPYLVGTSSVSLEPDSSIFSLSLAGFGFPREGRFSITWNDLNAPAPFSAIAYYKGQWYGVTRNGDLLKGKLAVKPEAWKRIGPAANTTALVIANDCLYAVRNGSLWSTPLNAGKLTWKKLDASRNFSALATLNNKIYAATTNDDLLVSTSNGRSLSWKKIGVAEHIISMTAYGNKIYALNSGDTIWSAVPRSSHFNWMQIGRLNGVTVTDSLQHIVVAGNSLYGIGRNEKWFRAAHSSNGNLTARSVAIKQGKTTVVMVGLDLTGFNATLTDDIKKAIFKKRGIPAAAILINASHTHFAPVTQAWTTWGDFYHVPDSNYLNNIVKKRVIQSIEKALDNMKPSRISFGRGRTEIGANRRSSGTNIKPNDPTLDVLKFESEDNGSRTILFLTGCHPVFKNAGREGYTLDANYPGVAKKLVEEKATAGNAIFIQGCGGDINPKSDNHINTGEELSVDVLNVLNNSMTPVNGKISFFIDKLLIPVKPWSRDSILRFRAINETKPGDVEAEKNIRWSNLMLDRYKNGTLDTTMPVYVQTINIGNWKLVGLSREVVNEYAPAIRGIWPQQIVSVAGYCNDVASYLPISWHIREQHYEGLSSFLWYGQPGIPPLNVLDLVVEKIKSFNR